MSSKIIIILSLYSLLACCKKVDTVFSQSQLMHTKDDTIVVRQSLEIGKKYFLVLGKDTSKFECVFSESKEKQRVSIHFDYKLVNGPRSKLYKERLEELKIIVSQKASKDFDLSHLYCFGFGLLSSGDLAIEISREYEKRIGVNTLNSKEMRSVIYDSRLKADLDKIFKPYHVVVEKIDVEKLIFSDRESLYELGEVETDRTNAPPRLLDCRIQIYFKTQ
jgi:hypothetical protein